MAITLEEGQSVIDHIMEGINHGTNHTLVKAHQILIQEAIMDYASMALSNVASCKKEVADWANEKLKTEVKG